MTEGDKVVCVNDEAPPHLRAHYVKWIKKGTIYVIRGVFLGVDYQTSQAGEIGLYLLGIHNPRSNVPPYPERGYNAMRFRLLETPPPKEQHEEVEQFAVKS